MWKHCVIVVALTACLSTASCGSGNAAGVSGQILYKGKPVSNADVTFTPESAGGNPATGRTDTNGHYSLSTPPKGEGASPGKYKVHIIARGPDRPPKPGETGSGMPGEMMPGDPIIPQKYFAPDSSGLTFEVKRGSNRANFDLTD